ncbi:MAG: hypothetical protein EBY82_05560, partial [Actinobacteria bacterium]|nr:hypothetical protein [Actinomycetota bacterium]
MKAAVITGVKKIEIVDVPMPAIGPRDVLLKVKSAGLCTWEQRIYTGQAKSEYPVLGGHENAGEIAAVGELVTNVKVGDRVTMGSSSCGTCRACLRGQDKGCTEHFLNFSLKGGSYGPGGFAEYKIHRSDGVFPVGHAALAEPLSCAIHAARLLDARLGDTAVVFGAGTMGLLNLMVLKKSGLRVAVVDVNEGRLAKATSLGADIVLKAGPDIRDRVKAAFLGGVDFSIAAYGSEEVNQDALDVLNNRGKICLFASAHPVTPFAIDPNLMHNRETSAVGVV